MKALFAWTYEFGYEILSWTNILRKNKNNFKKLYTASFVGREFLYKDFSDKHITYPEKFNGILPNNERNPNSDLSKELKKYLSQFVDDSFTIYLDSEKPTVNDYPIGWGNDYYGKFGETISYKTKKTPNIKPGFIVINPRYAKTHNGKDWNTNKNYPLYKWENFILMFLNTFKDKSIILFTFGESPFEQIKHERVILIQNPSVEDQVCFLNSAECAVHSQSGATFLSLLCGIPVYSICIKQDFETIDIKNSIFRYNYKILKSENNDISCIKVNDFFDDFKTFYEQVKK